MKERNKSFSVIITIVLSLLVWGLMALLYDFYYDMNDDVLIKDILSGMYTGKPDGHNMQMQFMLGWVIALLYRAYPMIPWMGIAEIAMMIACFALLVSRISDVMAKRVKKRYRAVTGMLAYIAAVVFTIGCVGYELVIIQYTFVCGVLALTAGILVLTDTSERFTIQNNTTAIVLALLAFNVRSEMFLLMCPFLAAAGICRWMREGMGRYNIKNYLGFLGIIAAGMILSVGIETLAYRSTEWKEFREFFDARTQVYDFTGIAPYEGNESFYESLDMTQEDVESLEEYNFTSFPVTTYVLNKIAVYSSGENAVTTKTHKSLPYAVKEYVVSAFKIMLPSKWKAARDDDSAFYEDGRISAPYNLLIIVLYIIMVASIIIHRDRKMLIYMLLIMAMRSISWIYVIYKDRVNARIAHPMYICEIIMIVSLLVMAKSDNIRRIALLSVIIIAGMYIPAVLGNIGDKIEIRENNNRLSNAVYEYTSANPRNYYYLDVYTMTGCSEKIFVKRKYGKGNTQLAGGWIALSPLDSYKQSYYQNDSRRFISRDYIEDRGLVEEIPIEGTEETLKVYIEKGYDQSAGN